MKRKPKKLADLDSFNIDQLMSDMEELQTILSKLPDSKEWDLAQLDDIEGVRDNALSLAREIESIFEALRGTNNETA